MADPLNSETTVPKHSKLFGVKGAARERQSDNWRNYDEYEDDRYGEELGEDARVWRVLLDQGSKSDAKTFQGLRDHLDVDLVFSGLFAAVVSAFVVQSSQALQPDHAEISVPLLEELIAVQRAMANGSPVGDVEPSRLSADSVTATTLDYWTNRLWYASLLLGLLAAFLAFIVRGWLHAYDRDVHGSPRRRALVQHYRRIGMERWNVDLVVHLLPAMLHTSMLLFFVGLSLYLRLFDASMSYFATALTASFYCFYLWSIFMPVIDPQCPYRSPLTDWAYWVKALTTWMCAILSPRARNSFVTQADHEWDAIAKRLKGLVPHSLERAMRESPSLSVALTVIQAASSFTVGLDHDHSQYPDKEHRKYALLRESMLSWLYGALTSRRAVFEWAPGRENELQRLACCLLLAPLEKLGKELDRQQYCMCGIRIWTALEQAIISREVMDAAAPSVCATLLALRQRLKVLDHRYNVPVNRALQKRMIEVYAAMIKRSPHARLRLRPVVWDGMLESLTSCPASTEISLPFALVLWRSLNCSTSYVPKDDSPGNAASSTIMTLQAWLFATKQSSLVAQGVIHRFICPPSCQVLPQRLDDRLSSASNASTISTTSIARSDSAWLHMACRAINLYVGMDDASRGAAFNDHLGFLAEQFVSTLANDLGYGPVDTALQIVGHPRVSSLFELNFHPRPSPGLGEMIKLDEGLPDDLVGPLFWFLVDLLQAVVDAPAGHDHNAASQGDKATKEIAHALRSHVQRHREYLTKTLIEDVDSLELLCPLARAIITHPELVALSVFTDALAVKMALLLRRLVTRVSAQPSADADQPQVIGAGRGDQPSQDLVWCMWMDAFCRGTGQANAAASDALHGALVYLTRIHQEARAREATSINSQPLSVPSGMTLRSPRSREVLAELVPDPQAVFSEAMISIPPDTRRIFVVDPDRHGNDSDSSVSISELVSFDECHTRMRTDVPAYYARSLAVDTGESEEGGEVDQWTTTALNDFTSSNSALRWVRRHLASTRRSRVVDEENASSLHYRAPSLPNGELASSSRHRAPSTQFDEGESDGSYI